MTLWEFEGALKYSPLFYGWYTNVEPISGYRLPLAYFITGLVAYGYSFFAVLRRMAKNSRLSKLSEKDDECIFSWKLFTAWDYMIGNAETAHNRVAAVVVGFKEALLEEAEKQRTARSWKIVTTRLAVNIVVMALLGLSAFAVVLVVQRSTEVEPNSSFWRKNEISVAMSLITSFFPMLFEGLGFLEQYHPRKQLRLQLARIMVLNLLNLYSLIFALFDKISDMTKELSTYHPDQMASNFESTIYPSTMPCIEICPGLSTESSTPYEDIGINMAAIASALTRELNTGSALNVSTDHVIPFLKNFTDIIKTNNTTWSEDFDELKQSFVDYLSYILASVEEFNTTFSNRTIMNGTVAEILSTTTVTSDSTSTTTISDLEERFVTELVNVTNSTPNSTSVCFCKEETSGKAMEMSNFNYTYRNRLKSLCWETMFGQELIKITVMDFFMTIISTLFMDFFRGIFVRVMNRCWCWDLEKKFPQYADFKVAENILHLVNNQGMVWMGMFFSPGLVVLNVLKLHLLMYFRAWTVLTCNIPHEVIFRASRSNNFYYALLLMMLFLCVLPVGYAIVMTPPSWHCGPFSNYTQIYRVFTTSITDKASPNVKLVLNYIASPAIIIPLLVLLILVIYYLLSLTAALREANEDLKMQLRKERTEERRKMFKLVDRRRVGSAGSTETPFGKWKKLLNSMPGKSSEETPKQDSAEATEVKGEKTDTNFLHKFIKKALRKSSTSDVEDQDGTDNEQQECLPEDQTAEKPGTLVSKTIVVLKSKDVQDNIPLIKISKTESAERLQSSEEPFKPKIKYALKKQNSEFDQDAVFHFGQDPHEKLTKEMEKSSETPSPDTVLDVEDQSNEVELTGEIN